MSSFESVHPKANRKSRFAVLPSVLGLLLASSAVGQTPSGFPAASPVLPYTPSLDLSAMDRSADPCVDLYQYSCGGWKQHNPIPPDQTFWSVYGKLYQDNLIFLHDILDQAVAVASATP
jgi:putative endopeptidase